MVTQARAAARDMAVGANRAKCVRSADQSENVILILDRQTLQ
jgi:hypothetical protein